MAKFLRIAPFSGYVRKTLASDHNEVWVTYEQTWDDVTPFDNNMGYTDLITFSGFEHQAAGSWWNGFFHYWEDDNDSGATGAANTPDPSPLGTWMTCELHFNRNVLVEFYIDGSLVFSGSENYDEPVRAVRFGGTRDLTLPLYMDNFKIGTSRGASDLFSEDFEGADPLANFSSTNGDLRVVSEFDPPPIVPVVGPPTFEWRFAVARLETMRILAWLSKIANQQQVTFELNKPAIGTGVVPSDSPLINLVQGDGYPIIDEGVRVLFGFRRESDTASPYKWNCHYAGIIMQLEDNIDEDGGVAPYTTYTAYDPRQLLYKRPVRNADGSLPGPAGCTFTGMRGDEIIEALLERSFDNDGEHYILTPISAEATDVISKITFQQHTSVGEAFDQITDSGNCDIIFDAYYFPNLFPTKIAQVTVFKLAGYNFDGTPDIKYKAPLAWDLPRRNLVTMNRLKDGTQRANRIQYSAEQDGKIAGTESDFLSVAKYGQYWSEQAFPGSNLAAVELLAAEQVIVRSNGVETFKVTPVPGTLGQVNSPIFFFDYVLGTLLPMYASKRLRQAVSVAKRVIKIPIVIRDDGAETMEALEFGEGQVEIEPNPPEAAFVLEAKSDEDNNDHLAYKDF